MIPFFHFDLVHLNTNRKDKIMPYRKPPITKLTDKFLGFCAVTPNRKFMNLFERADVKNVLVSYHYIRKNPTLTGELLDQVRSRGGLFMTDSGAFSFLNDKSFDPTRFDWDSYVEEYAIWLDNNKSFIFSACNLDVDLFVGANRVRRWNETYFEKLGEEINTIYVAHPNVFGKGRLDSFKEYCDQYSYVAVNEKMKDEVSSIYQTAKITKTCIHGLAWTKPTLLDDNPFFSVDSSSWVNYQKYGATPVFDGSNFKQYDNNEKSIRTTQKMKCEHYGVKYYEFVNEKDEETGKHNDDEGLTFSLRSWMDVFNHIKKFARTKLNFTLADMLQGKQTVFVEDQSGTPAPATGGRGILGSLANKGIVSHNAVATTYQTNDDGSEVAMYEKRQTGKIAIADFIKTSGDVMICNYCHIAEKCPLFKEDNTCGFDFSQSDANKDPLSTINNLIAIQTERVNRALLMEKMEGGNINKVYSAELKALDNLNISKMNILTTIQNKGIDVKRVVVEHVNMDQSQGQTIDVTPQKPAGFQEMLLGMLSSGDK